MEVNEFSKFKLRVNINAPIEQVFDRWATPAGLESWFLRNAKFYNNEGQEVDKNSHLKEGSTYEWYWHGYSDAVVEKGKVLKVENGNHFAFTFSLECKVTISIYAEEGETICELVESDLPVDEETIKRHYAGDSRGWVFYLANLKSILEGGLDLRNKKEEIRDVITA